MVSRLADMGVSLHVATDNSAPRRASRQRSGSHSRLAERHAKATGVASRERQRGGIGERLYRISHPSISNKVYAGSGHTAPRISRFFPAFPPVGAYPVRQVVPARVSRLVCGGLVM